MYVIQKHSARRLHYDLRLEWNGALHSWAVPNGLPWAAGERHMAVEVEDHPMEYADFEGVIPKGNYGAGAAIVWDRGLWTAREGPGEGIEVGKLHFELKGHKLHGTWILVRTKDDPKSWLLIRKLEKGEDPGPPPGEESILSGLLVEEVLQGRDRAVEVRAELERRGIRRAPVDPARVGLMLAEPARKPFSAPGWIFEIKYDGYRALGSRISEGRPHLRSRGGEDMTAVFPEIARALAALPFDGLVLDGELVVLNTEGRPHFHALQRRGQIRRRLDAERAAREIPAVYFAFDLLAVEGFDLRERPLLERKELLRGILPKTGFLRYCDHIEERGAEMFARIREMGLEGLMAKEAGSAYVSGRSACWKKIVTDRTGDFAVVGYTVMGGTRDSRALGALLLATGGPRGGWMYAGRVGTGFTDADRSGIFLRLQDGDETGPRATPRETPVCEIPTEEKSALRRVSRVWIEPELVATVKYRSKTDSGSLRAPVFVRLRDDKRVEDFEEADAPSEALPPAAPSERRALPFTHLEKVFWPEDGFTKGDLIAYYRDMAPLMLPYLEDRPVVLTRYPDGIAGKNFYQKDAPAHAAEWVRTARIFSTHAEKEIAYFVCDDADSLLYLANLGSIPIHVWSSRASTLANPDWCILDFDPKGAPFAHVLRLTLAMHDLCREIGIPSFVKTSGSTGLHVLLPLPPGTTFDQSRILAQLLSAIIAGDHPEIATTTRNIADRGGRVYLDALQNRHGQLLVAPYSVRPLPGAPVSAPLEWSEVNDKLLPRAFTMRNMRQRVTKQAGDPMSPLLGARLDLLGALRRLEDRVRKAGS